MGKFKIYKNTSEQATTGLHILKSNQNISGK